MSSHHFVKEGQEPALLIGDALPYSLIAPLLEWAPYVMVLDTCLDAVLTWGIKIDAVMIQEKDLALMSEKTIDQSPLDFFYYDDADQALIHAVKQLAESQRAINILASPSAEKFQHLLIESFGMSMVVFDGHYKWAAVRKSPFTKWIAADVDVQLRKSHPNQSFQIEGLKLVNNDAYKSTHDTRITIKSDGPFWIGEAVD